MVLGHTVDSGRRTQDVKVAQDITFETMLLSDTTLQGLKNSGFYKPSPIQLHGIPLGKCGFDLLLEAKSGTGKTAVFTVIALDKINLNNGLQVVILAPTREIAAQICDVIKQIGEIYTGLTTEVVMGGLPVKDDIQKLKKKVHIIVGSPGRLHHLIRDNHIDVSAVRLLVLDEADKLMEKSFRTDIEFIFSTLPLQKQIIFSSATFPEESKAFINKYVQVSQHVCPDSNSVLLGIAQKVTIVPHHTNIVRQTQHRFEELLNILSKREFKQCLIFCNYQARVTDLYKMLTKAKWPAEKLYGQQEQLDRLEALKTLQEYKCRILIATDLAARGLDSSHVDLVVNFEPPNEWQTYLHRIGRAGRFGSYGLAVTILSRHEETKFKDVLNAIHFQLDIRSFWNDEQFQYNEYNTKTPIPLEDVMSILNLDDETSNEDCYSELWNTLICEPTHNGNPTETFDMLRSSFKETKDQIETFTDLLESFQKNDEEVDSSSKYQCFNQAISISKYKHPTKQNKSSTDNEIKKELEVEASQDNVVPKYDLNRRSSPTEQNQNNTQNKVHKNNKDIFLPKKSKVTDVKNNNGKLGRSQKKPTFKDEKYASCLSESDDTDDNGYNTASYDFKKSQCCSVNNKSYTHIHSSKSNQYYPLRQNRHNEQVHQYSSNYINWYNYLKFRTQQIQMAVYINELSQFK